MHPDALREPGFSHFVDSGILGVSFPDDLVALDRAARPRRVRTR